MSRLERLDGIYTPRIVAMVLNERMDIEVAMGFFNWIMNQNGFNLVITQFVARKKGYKVEVQTGVTGTYPTQCHHDGEVLSL
jgi:hypothetical protein